LRAAIANDATGPFQQLAQESTLSNLEPTFAARRRNRVGPVSGFVQITALDVYGWLCLVFFLILFREAANNEISGRARAYDWVPRAASWMYPVACLLMAEVAWYLERVYQ
jgi:hypothetical protein